MASTISRNFVVSSILAILVVNTCFLYWAATTTSSYAAPPLRETFEGFSQGAETAVEPAGQVGPGILRGGLERLISGYASLEGEVQHLPLLDALPCEYDLIEDDMLPLTVLLVVDYTTGGAALHRHDQLWAGMAHMLTEQGTKGVTVLFAAGAETDWAQTAVRNARNRYRGNTISFATLPPPRVPRSAPPQVAVAYDVYEWLQNEHQFDVVYFIDWGGLGYFAMTAKKQGLAFHDIELGVLLTGPRVWEAVYGAEAPALHTPASLEASFMERLMVEKADVVVARGNFLVQWLRDRGWIFPPKTVVATFPAPHTRLPASQRGGPQSGVPIVQELVYVGALDAQSGLLLFLEAVERVLCEGGEQKNLGLKALTFSGPNALLDPRQRDVAACPNSPPEGSSPPAECVYGHEHIMRTMQNWQKKRCDGKRDRDCIAQIPSVTVETQWEMSTLLSYLVDGRGRLAVLPAPMDSPDTILQQIMEVKAPFISSDVGMARELISAGQHDHVLFKPRPAMLSKLLNQVLGSGGAPIAEDAANRSIAVAPLQWKRWHDCFSKMYGQRISVNQDGALKPAPQENGPGVLVTCVLVHHDRQRHLASALASLRAQDYPHLEVVLVDDGSSSAEALRYLEEISAEDSWFTQRGWRALRLHGMYVGAARNAGWRAAKGQYVLFMDDDNYAKPHEVSRMVEVAQRTGADVVTCANDFMPPGVDAPALMAIPEGRYIPLGPALMPGVLRNVFGDANALFARSALDALSGGWPEETAYAVQDWELHTRAALRGLRLEVIPEALYWYRTTDNSMARSPATSANNLQFHLRPYVETLGPLGELATYTQQITLHAQALEQQVRRLREGTRSTELIVQSLYRQHCESRSRSTQRAGSRGHNFIQNARFDAVTAEGKLIGWIPHGNRGFSIIEGGRRGGGKALLLDLPSVAEVAGATQHVYIGQKDAAPLILQGWSRAVDGGISGVGEDDDYSLYADLFFVDGTHQWGYTLPFRASSTEWQHVHGVIHPSKPLLRIELVCLLRWRRGRAVFDDIRITSLDDGVCDVLDPPAAQSTM
ncbi:hypothetical protein CYMTET_54711 [Cymbomonas tetramitiformis]|uniref:Glycosyltransferase 2-like domain-containing protein n=1 Tax=Cymbomonas tetramitiformis TaxID=36881 RepID=A0AAE0BG60_9CHLO|nr:hypothetical protein CYMTET_54711 [Cymbomonas tetramitiformis]